MHKAPPDCVGCLSCAHICPTNVIEYSNEGDILTIWDKEFELLKCSKCGKATITKDFAKALSETKNIPMSYFEVCDDCHRNEISLTLGSIASWQREVQP